MASSHDFACRLFVTEPLAEAAVIALDRGQANYLLSVLRLEAGREILVFNGRDGEWRAMVEPTGRKAGRLVVAGRIRPQTPHPDILLLFTPLKQARLDYAVQKAVEMGAGAIRPVVTRRTIASRVNRERLEANIVEAAEQCGVLAVPVLLPELGLAQALQEIETDRLVVFCDEDAAVGNPLAALDGMRRGTPCAVLIGPEGGFDPQERALILALPTVCRLSLGPRILRADTAAVAALAIVQAVLGDWHRDDGGSLQGRLQQPM